MFEIGDKIVYSRVGICCVEDVGPAARPLPGSDPTRHYYTLRPLHDSGVVYTPVDTTVYMRPVMSRDQAQALIDNIAAIQPIECQVADHRQLADHYRGILQTYESEKLLALLKALWQRQQACRSKGKTLGKVDRQYQQTAEKFLYQELACALDQPVDDIAAMVRGMLAEN